MKKTLIFLSLAFAAVSVSCRKEQTTVSGNEAEPVSIFAAISAPAPAPAPAPASPATPGDVKTNLDVSTWKVSWNAKDDLTVFNAGAGETTYSANCRFLISGTPADGCFVKDAGETSKSLIGGKEAYDWYVCYPWMQYGANPGGTKGYTVALAPQQIGYNNTAAVSEYDILAGKALSVSDGTSPQVQMKHVCTLFKFHVTNNTGKDAVISGLTLDAADAGTYITGSFTLDWANLALTQTMGSSKSYVCDLSVKKNTGTEDSPVYADTDETVANGESVDLYFVTAPFTIAAGKKITLTIKGSLGNCVLTKTMSSDMKFEAGKYNTANLSYTQPEYVVFTETFGANTVATASVPSYGKAGLTTAVAAHKDAYRYAVNGNASFAPLSIANKNKNPNWLEYLDGAAVKLPATTSTAGNSSITISGITVEPNTAYIFKYNKSKGAISDVDFNTPTQFKYRENEETPWTIVNRTEDAGTIVQEFTTGDYESLIICVEAAERLPSGTIQYYPSVDYFQLIRK